MTKNKRRGNHGKSQRNYRRTRPKSGYKKQGNKKGRGVKEKRYRG